MRVVVIQRFTQVVAVEIRHHSMFELGLPRGNDLCQTVLELLLVLRGNNAGIELVEHSSNIVSHGSKCGQLVIEDLTELDTVGSWSVRR